MGSDGTVVQFALLRSSPQMRIRRAGPGRAAQPGKADLPSTGPGDPSRQGNARDGDSNARDMPAQKTRQDPSQHKEDSDQQQIFAVRSESASVHLRFSCSRTHRVARYHGSDLCVSHATPPIVPPYPMSFAVLGYFSPNAVTAARTTARGLEYPIPTGTG